MDRRQHRLVREEWQIVDDRSIKKGSHQRCPTLIKRKTTGSKQVLALNDKYHLQHHISFNDDMRDNTEYSDVTLLCFFYYNDPLIYWRGPVVISTICTTANKVHLHPSLLQLVHLHPMQPGQYGIFGVSTSFSFLKHLEHVGHIVCQIL